MRIVQILDKSYISPMRNAAQIIDLWPSRTDLARELDVSYQTISKWRTRRSIPPSYWKGLLMSAAAHDIEGVSAMTLVEAHALVPQSDEDGAVASPAPGLKTDGHFTRFRHLARPHFQSLEEVNAHIAALRDERQR